MSSTPPPAHDAPQPTPPSPAAPEAAAPPARPRRTPGHWMGRDGVIAPPLAPVLRDCLLKECSSTARHDFGVFVAAAALFGTDHLTPARTHEALAWVTGFGVALTPEPADYAAATAEARQLLATNGTPPDLRMMSVASAALAVTASGPTAPAAEASWSATRDAVRAYARDQGMRVTRVGIDTIRLALLAGPAAYANLLEAGAMPEPLSLTPLESTQWRQFEHAVIGLFPSSKAVLTATPAQVATWIARAQQLLAKRPALRALQSRVQAVLQHAMPQTLLSPTLPLFLVTTNAAALVHLLSDWLNLPCYAVWLTTPFAESVRAAAARAEAKATPAAPAMATAADATTTAATPDASGSDASAPAASAPAASAPDVRASATPDEAWPEDAYPGCATVIGAQWPARFGAARAHCSPEVFGLLTLGTYMRFDLAPNRTLDTVGTFKHSAATLRDRVAQHQALGAASSATATPAPLLPPSVETAVDTARAAEAAHWEARLTEERAAAAHLRQALERKLAAAEEQRAQDRQTFSKALRTMEARERTQFDEVARQQHHAAAGRAAARAVWADHGLPVTLFDTLLPPLQADARAAVSADEAPETTDADATLSPGDDAPTASAGGQTPRLDGQRVLLFTGQKRQGIQQLMADTIRDLGGAPLVIDLERSTGPRITADDIVIIDTTFASHTNVNVVRAKAMAADTPYLLHRVSPSKLADHLTRWLQRHSTDAPPALHPPDAHAA